MVRSPIPPWLMIVLSIAGVMTVVGVYGILSARQTAINKTQSVLPGIKGMTDGLSKIRAPQGTETNRKPSWLWQDTKASLTRLFAGTAIGVLASIVIGILMGSYRWIEAPLAPIISFMAKIPPTAMLPLYMVAFGTSTNLFIAMVALGIFFSMAQSVFQATRQDVTQEAIQKAYTLGASDMEIIFEIIWPQIMPRILENIRLQIGPAMVFLIAAEVLFADVGFGYRIRMESRLLRMNTVYWYLALLGGFGLLLDWLMLKLRQRLAPWFQG
jgi:NitT/TauT family transport system permease protein